MSEHEKSLPPPGAPEFASPESDGAANQAAKADTMPSLEELLKQAELKAEEHHDAWLRAKAETENVRKRAQLDVANAYKYSVESMAERLLPVRDALEAALAADNATAETLRSGAELTLKQLDAAFERASLAEIDPAGQKFDPHQHQAIGMVDADGEPNCVVSVLQKGYRLHDRIVRPALVTVSKAKQA
jgi:molecular chaperone GrpE